MDQGLAGFFFFLKFCTPKFYCYYEIIGVFPYLTACFPSSIATHALKCVQCAQKYLYVGLSPQNLHGCVAKEGDKCFYIW